MSQEFVEGLKELIRTAMMAVLPTIIFDLQSNQFHWYTWAISFVIALLSGIDKWLHLHDVRTFLDLRGMDVLVDK